LEQKLIITITHGQQHIKKKKLLILLRLCDAYFDPNHVYV